MSLIESEALIAKALLKDVDYVYELIALVQEITPSNAIEVVRCAECIAWNREYNMCNHSGRVMVGPNSYCDRGTTRNDPRL